MMAEESRILPAKPEKPLDSDCCGQGCVPCVFDIYEQEMKIWELECARINSQDDGLCTDNSNNRQLQDYEFPLLSPNEYHKFRVESVTPETGNAHRYRILLPSGHSLGLKVGQHVILRGRSNGQVITRQYTPISDVSCNGQATFLIKLYDGGRMSQFIRTLTPESVIELRGPFGNFSYQANQYTRLYALAAGTGVAPMAQVFQTVLNNEDDETVIHLIYACRTYENILLKPELDEWSKFWNFTSLYVLSQEIEKTPHSNYKYGERLHFGRISREMLEEEIHLMNKNFLILICGTQSFEHDMIKYLLELGISQQQYFKF